MMEKEIKMELIHDNNNYSMLIDTPEEDNDINDRVFNSGRWSINEHEQFLVGLRVHGRNWKMIQSLIKTRSATQVRTHAQKFFTRDNYQATKRGRYASRLKGIESPDLMQDLRNQGTIKSNNMEGSDNDSNNINPTSSMKKTAREKFHLKKKNAAAMMKANNNNNNNNSIHFTSSLSSSSTYSSFPNSSIQQSSSNNKNTISNLFSMNDQKMKESNCFNNSYTNNNNQNEVKAELVEKEKENDQEDLPEDKVMNDIEYDETSTCTSITASTCSLISPKNQMENYSIKVEKEFGPTSSSFSSTSLALQEVYETTEVREIYVIDADQMLITGMDDEGENIHDHHLHHPNIHPHHHVNISTNAFQYSCSDWDDLSKSMEPLNFYAEVKDEDGSIDAMKDDNNNNNNNNIKHLTSHLPSHYNNNDNNNSNNNHHHNSCGDRKKDCLEWLKEKSSYLPVSSTCFEDVIIMSK